MSSDAKLAAISETDMKTIRAVLLRAGYGAGAVIDNEYQHSAAALLLMQKVRSGERSAVVLQEYLEHCFGRPTKYRVLFAPILPRYAIQGLPRIRKMLLRPMEMRVRLHFNDLQSWENEGGSPSKA